MLFVEVAMPDSRLPRNPFLSINMQLTELGNLSSSLCLKTEVGGDEDLAKGCGPLAPCYFSYCVNIVKHSYSLKVLPSKASY